MKVPASRTTSAASAENQGAALQEAPDRGLRGDLRGLGYEAGRALLTPGRAGAPVQMKGRAVQRRGEAAAVEGSAVQEAAAEGTRGAGGALPHLGAIQKAFGRHDVSSAQAYTGGEAADACDRMGAEAYASGSRVAFKGAPDLHLAAHEAAHVVQQRAGVQLSGGVGAAGDGYERHADEVADRVVAGRSAEDLLDGMAPQPAAEGGVQRSAVQFGQREKKERERAALGRLKEELTAQLETTTDLDATYAELWKRHCHERAELDVLKEVKKGIDLKKGREVQDGVTVAATMPVAHQNDLGASKMVTAMLALTNLAEFEAYCEGVVKVWGIAPLDTIEDHANNPANALPLQQVSNDGERTAIVHKLRTKAMKAAGEKNGIIPPQKFDAGNRLAPDNKKKLGPGAKHKEALHVVGDRTRQLVLGMGYSSDPDGYANFAKDYGIWDFESWAMWNTAHSDKFGDVGGRTNPNLGADVQTLLTGKDKNGAEIIERIHFRLDGLFPGEKTIEDKITTAYALYMNKPANFGGQQVNDLFTCGEVVHIVNDPSLQQKTALYDGKGGYQEAAELLSPDNIQNKIGPAVMSKGSTYDATIKALESHYRTRYFATDKPKLQRVCAYIAKNIWMIPMGKDAVISKVDGAVA